MVMILTMGVACAVPTYKILKDSDGLELQN